jgi:hypothetical protein
MFKWGRLAITERTELKKMCFTNSKDFSVTVKEGFRKPLTTFDFIPVTKQTNTTVATM